ncbi:hypothetical protein COP1_040530 [Malus domestica]
MHSLAEKEKKFTSSRLAAAMQTRVEKQNKSPATWVAAGGPLCGGNQAAVEFLGQGAEAQQGWLLMRWHGLGLQAQL